MNFITGVTKEFRRASRHELMRKRGRSAIKLFGFKQAAILSHFEEVTASIKLEYGVL